MSEIGDRYRRVAAGFTARVEGVAAGDWDRPSPCEGWVARDVVRHLVEWVPAFFGAAGGPAFAVTTSVDDDPAGAWREVDAALRAGLDDPTVAGSEVAHPRAGTHRFEDAVDTFVTGDVLVHTWDLARATGQDERLDPAEVGRLLASMEPLDEALRASGQFGPRVEVPADADDQTRLLAFSGRRP